MEEYIEMVKSYDGEPVEYTTEGLFQKMAKAGLL